MLRLVAICAGLAFAGTVHAQLRPTQPPAGRSRVGDDVRPTGSVPLRPAPGSPQKPRSFDFGPAVVGPLPRPSLDFALGIFGYDSGVGFVILAPRTVLDYDIGRRRVPVADCGIDLLGNGVYQRGHLDIGDRIVAINGYAVSSLPEVIAVVQTAALDPVLDLSVVDYATGQEYRAQVRAARMTPPIVIQTAKPR